MAVDAICEHCGSLECPQCHRKEAYVIVTRDARKVYCYVCRFEVDLDLYDELIEDYHLWVKSQKSFIDV